MKAVKYYIFFTLIIATITSCNYQNNKLSIIKSNGLEADNFGIQTMFFYDKDTGFIGGSSDIITHNPDENSNQFAFVNKTALLYKTTDGGYTWRENKFGEGSFQNILYNEGKYYAFKIKENYYTDIYCSEDFGRNWRVKTSFPNVVTDLFFIKEQIVIVAKDERRVFQFFVSNNGGLNWVKRTSTYSPIYDIIKSEESNFYYLSSKNNRSYKKDLLVNFNMQDSISNAIELPNRFDCYFLTKNANQVKLCGKQNNQITVYSLVNQKMQFEYSAPEKDSMSFPFAFYNTKNDDYIVIGRRNSIEVEHKIIKTSDNGNTWDIIKFKKENVVSPFYFLNDSGKVKAWFFSGSETFQILQ